MGTSEKSKKTGKKHIIDVQKPGAAAPSPTSKPVIVGNRPLLKDPMVVDGSQDTEKKIAEPPKLSTADKPKLQPLDPTLSEEKPDDGSPVDKPKVAESDVSPTGASLDTLGAQAPASESADEPMTQEPVEETGTDTSTNPRPDSAQPMKKKEGAAGHEKAEREAAIQRLVDSKEYVLPIHTAEQRNSKRVVILGVALSVVLLLLWLNIALDAGIIHFGGLKSLTNFFPN